MPGLRRVESQLLMLRAAPDRPVPFSGWAHVHPRWFFQIPLTNPQAPVPAELHGIRVQPWRETHFDDSAKLLAHAYRGNIDSEINDQYRSPAGARRFLSNIVEFPGCGTFFPAASYVAFDAATGVLCGMCLASLVAREAGHVTQLCVAPSHRNVGLGGQLLRRSLLAFAAYDCRSASLTVTAANENAARLYENMGFVRRRSFAAHVWDFR